MKKVLAMSILTMIVMSMGGCGASSDSCLLYTSDAADD